MENNVRSIFRDDPSHVEINKRYMQWSANPLSHLKQLPLALHGYSITMVYPDDYLKIEYVFHEPFPLRFDDMEIMLSKFLTALSEPGYITPTDSEKIATICTPIAGLWKIIIADEDPKGWLALECDGHFAFYIHMWDGEDHYSFKFVEI